MNGSVLWCKISVLALHFVSIKFIYAVLFKQHNLAEVIYHMSAYVLVKVQINAVQINAVQIYTIS